MNEVRFISGQAALQDYIHGIDMDARKGLDDRNINATGALKKSHRTNVIIGTNSSTASLMALAYWTRAGSGSPPGTVANLEDLKEWLIAKGIARATQNPGWIAALIQDKIYLEGSRDFRMRKPNVYREAIRNNERKVPKVVNAFALDIARPIKTAFNALR